MGESSLQMWTEYPQLMSVTHPYAVNKGTNYIDINVTIGLEPVKDSWVTIYMEDGKIVLNSMYPRNNLRSLIK